MPQVQDTRDKQIELLKAGKLYILIIGSLKRTVNFILHKWLLRTAKPAKATGYGGGNAGKRKCRGEFGRSQ
jgi:hypothetical protein